MEDRLSAHDTLIAWAVSIMMTWANPAKMYPNDEAMQEAHVATYEDKARDAIATVYDRNNTSTIFGGKYGKAMDTALLLKIAASENSYIENPGGVPEINGGRSWCMMSLNIGNGKTIEGWTGPELDADRRKCFKAGYNAMKRSFGGCRRLPFKYGLSVYHSGKCLEDPMSETRINDAVWRVNKLVPTDELVLNELFPPREAQTEDKVSEENDVPES